jgi:hypothetical protein
MLLATGKVTASIPLHFMYISNLIVYPHHIFHPLISHHWQGQQQPNSRLAAVIKV